MFTCALLVPHPVVAQDFDPQAGAAALDLLDQADEAFDANQIEKALDLYTRAYGLVKAPTIAVRRGECLEKLGRILEAAEVYVHASRTNLAADAPEHFRQAVATAWARAEALQQRLAKLELTVEGERVEGATVLVNGREIPSVLVGAAFPVNPGKNVIEVFKGKRKASQTVTIPEKGKSSVTITLPPPQPGDEEEETGSTGSSGSSPSRPVVLESSSQATWGWVVMGLGIAGVATGGATGLVAMSQRSSLDGATNDAGNKQCVDKVCWGNDSKVDNYNLMRTVSTVGFAVGIVGVGTGLTLLLTSPAPKAREVEAKGVRPWVGVGSAGLEGRF